MTPARNSIWLIQRLDIVLIKFAFDGWIKSLFFVTCGIISERFFTYLVYLWLFISILVSEMSLIWLEPTNIKLLHRVRFLYNKSKHRSGQMILMWR